MRWLRWASQQAPRQTPWRARRARPCAAPAGLLLGMISQLVAAPRRADGAAAAAEAAAYQLNDEVPELRTGVAGQVQYYAHKKMQQANRVAKNGELQ